MMTRATNNARKRKKMEVAGRGSICSTGTDEKPFVGKMKHNRHRPHRHVYSAVLGSHKIGQSDLSKAVLAEQIDKVEALLCSGADACTADSKGRTPLHFAVTTGNCTLVNLLLQHGADTNQMDCLGNTPLHLAVCSNHIQVVTILLRAGTDLSLSNEYGNTPLHLAQSRLRILQEGSLTGRTPDAVKAEVSEVLQMLQEYFRQQQEHSEAMEQLLSLADKLSLSTTEEEIGELHGLLDDFTTLSLKTRQKQTQEIHS